MVITIFIHHFLPPAIQLGCCKFYNSLTGKRLKEDLSEHIPFMHQALLRIPLIIPWRTCVARESSGLPFFRSVSLLGG